MPFKKGKDNPRWSGGNFEYPDHSTLKKNRLKVLEAANYICQVCGGLADRTHHKDGKKTDHSPENLEAVCPKCNLGHYHKGAIGRKFKYGFDCGVIAKKVGCHKRIVQSHMAGKPSKKYGKEIERAIIKETAGFKGGLQR